MTKQLAFPVQIRLINHKGLSVNGNPRFEIVLDDMLSWTHVAKTQTDSSLGYKIGNKGYRVGDWVYVTLTKAGNISFMYLATAPDYAKSNHDS